MPNARAAALLCSMPDATHPPTLYKGMFFRILLFEVVGGGIALLGEASRHRQLFYSKNSLALLSLLQLITRVGHCLENIKI